MSENKKSFSQQMAKLESILEWFEQDDIDLDQALAKYEEGLKLTSALEDQLKATENKIKVIKSKNTK